MLRARLKTFERQLGSLNAAERAAAISGLERLRSAYALQLLFDGAQNAAYPSREQAAEAFSQAAGCWPRIALRHRNPALRIQAIRLYGQQQNVAAVPELSRMLRSDSNEDLRCLVAETLGQIGHASCVVGLSVPAKDPALRVRRTVLEALHGIPSASAERAQIEFLSDADWTLRRQACRHLESSGWQPATPRERALSAILNDRFDQAIRQGEGSKQMLLHASVYAKDAQTRHWAATALQRVPGQWAQEELRGLLNSSDSGVRQAAADALRILGPGRSAPRNVSPPTGRQPASAFAVAIHMLALAGEP